MFWPESTTTSPSGRHLGHYRALLQTLPVGNKAAEATDYKRGMLASMHHSILEYSLQNGHAFQRWKKVVNVMIEKEPGNPKIHRLRVIHLYEADYNVILGAKWRELIHHCEENHLLHPNLYGARPGREALDPVFIEELTNEITRMSLNHSSRTRKMLRRVTTVLLQVLEILRVEAMDSTGMWPWSKEKHWKK